MALILSAKIFALQPCWRVFVLFVHSSTQTTYLLLNGYLFEGYYFGAIMVNVKIAKIKCL